VSNLSERNVLYPIGCRPNGNAYQKRNILSRMWKKFLSSYEFNVLDTIFDRTVGWCNEVEGIPARHFLEGFSSKGKFACCGSTISEKTIKRVLISLEKKGYIAVTRNNGRRKPNRYSINFDFVPEGFEKLKPIPENLNPVQNVELKGQCDLTNFQLKGHSDPTYKEVENKKEEVSSAEAQDGAISTPRERAQKALSQSLTKKRKSRIIRSRKNTPDGWETVWRDEYKKCYPGALIPKFSGKQHGIMRNLHRRLNDDLVNRGSSFNEFLRFSVRNWNEVLDTKGSGIAEYKPSDRRYSQVPREPSVQYLSPCVDMFSRSFVRVNSGDFSQLSKTQRHVYEIMAREGLDYVDAVEAYAQAQAAVKVTEAASRKMKELEYREKELLRKKRREAFLRRSQRNKPKTSISPKTSAESSPQAESRHIRDEMTASEQSLHAEPLPAWDDTDEDLG